jgi:hypothetical protein
MSRSAVFRSIYRLNRWHGTETRSGPGSTHGATSRLRRILPELVPGIGNSFLDAACGASWWMPELPGYRGIDIVPEAVQAVANRFPHRSYAVGDICSEHLVADVVFMRDVLAHLSNDEVRAALGNVRATWLMATTFEGADNSARGRTGGYREYDLEREPFSLGKPWMTIEDGYWCEQGEAERLVYPNKMMGVWACAW